MRLLRTRSGAAETFASVQAPAPSTPWSQARWCALDLELTGLDPRRDDIISIGAVPIEHGRVLLGEAVYSLVRTTQRSQLGAVQVHKLRVPDLAKAPPLAEAIDVVLNALAGCVPVFHTAFVERAFLSKPFSRRRVRLPPAADTEVLGQRWLRHRDGDAPTSLALARLSQEMGMPAELAHHALGDALTTAEVFVALATLLDEIEPQTVATLLSAEERLLGARRFG